MASSGISRQDSNAIVDAILAGGGAALRDLFEAQAAHTPLVLWAPCESNFRNPQTRAFARTCGSLARPDGSLGLRRFDIEPFQPHLAWLMLLDVEDGGRAFRYSHFGDGVAQVRGLSMRGRTTADVGGYIGAFITASYRAVLRRKQVLLTVHEPPKGIFARNWERLIVPILSAGGDVARIAVMNVPDNELRAGLEIIPDPVMVLDGNQVVRYANRAARQVFDRHENGSRDQTLFDYAGIDLNIAESPEQLLRRRAVHDKICLAMRDSLLQDFLVTISGAELWGNAFYVITLRMDIRLR